MLPVKCLENLKMLFRSAVKYEALGVEQGTIWYLLLRRLEVLIRDFVPSHKLIDALLWQEANNSNQKIGGSNGKGEEH